MGNTDSTTRTDTLEGRTLEFHFFLIESRGTKLGAWISSVLCYQPWCRSL